MIGFARNIVFFRVNGGSVAEKSWLARATDLGVVALPSIPARFACAVELKVPGDFFFSLLMLCCCVLHVSRCFRVHWNCCIQAMELLHPSDGFHSSVLHFFCALQLSVCRSQWNAGRKVLAL